MRRPSERELLAAWERGLAAPAAERDVALLAAACDGAGEDPSRLTPGEVNRRLLGLRESLFGPDLCGVVACPSCGERMEVELTVGELSASAGAAELEPVAVSMAGWDIRARLPEVRDLCALAGAGQGGDPRAALLARCVLSAARDGAPAAIDALPPDVLEAVSRRMADADPLGALELDVRCIACGNAWLEPLDVSSFLWREVQGWASRVMHEVHQLASAYGWSEGEILALGPVRRHLYLSLAAE
jgi:hypothetical protein